MTHDYPKNFARFYDVIYDKIRDGVDNNFFLSQIKQVKGKVLEIGVGTGRFFKEAIKGGADVYGIDISKHMVGVLKEKLNKDQQQRISIQNMIDFHFDFQFDLIIAPFRVIMHIMEKEEQLKALDNVYRHLAPGGKFIFDVFVPDLNQLIRGLDRHIDFEGEYEPGKKLKRTVTTHPDVINQLINIHFRLEWEEESKTLQEEWKLALRFFFRYELEHLIERSKFENYYAIYGDYKRGKLSSDSREFIVECLKKRQ